MPSGAFCSLAALLLARGASAIAFIDGRSRDPRVSAVEDLSFSEFVAKFNRSYSPGTDEWARRETLFEQRKADVLAFLSGPPQSWAMGLTRFADYTPSEYRGMLGYKGRRGDERSPEGAAFARKRKWTYPTSYSTVGEEGTLRGLVRDQGQCGSCWAEAATATLEGQMESNATVMKHLRAVLDKMDRKDQVPTLSSQAMVSCTENPRNCGGSGGCQGATVELAYEMVKQKGGIPLAVEWSYESSGGATPACKEDIFQKVSLQIGGFEVLPSNKLHPLMQALYDSGGPVAVSVDASNWGMYSEGIFSDLDMGKGDFTVNHAVTLMAYKAPKRDAQSNRLEQGYWQIKNSWGVGWGEGGFIRLEMKENEEDHCGMDRSTHDGLACDGDPDTAWVCGTCGVLYDSVYPTGLRLA